MAGEVDVFISKHDAGEGLDGCRSVERQSEYHPRDPAPQRSSLVRQYCRRQAGPWRKQARHAEAAPPVGVDAAAIKPARSAR